MENKNSFIEFTKIFDITKKNNLLNHCKRLKINSRDFFYYQRLVENGNTRFFYRQYYREIVPSELNEVGKQMGNISSNDVENSEKSKIIKRLIHYANTRRFLVLHML